MTADPTTRPRRRWPKRVAIASAVVLGFLAIVLTDAGYRIMHMPGHSHTGPLPPLTADQAQVRDRLRAHVEKLAGEIGERNYRRPQALHDAATYISDTFKQLGYEPALLLTHVDGRDYANIEARIPGTTHPEQILVIGAHYDTVPDGPGANDNASAVAALLEIARAGAGAGAGQHFDRTIRFVAFFNEEGVGPLPTGSFVYATACKQRNENIVGMIALETIGYYTDAADSQHYPFPFSLFYPSTGNFLGFVGNAASRPFLYATIGSFRDHTAFPSRGVCAPDWLKDAGRSDHAAFWHYGYPAIMVTDTANFRYPHYHTPQDTPDKLDYDRTARVTEGLTHAIMDLATYPH